MSYTPRDMLDEFIDGRKDIPEDVLAFMRLLADIADDYRAEVRSMWSEQGQDPRNPN